MSIKLSYIFEKHYKCELKMHKQNMRWDYENKYLPELNTRYSLQGDLGFCHKFGLHLSC